MGNISFFALAFRMKHITRWGLMRNSISENLTEHSAETAMIAHALAVIGNKIYGKKYDPGKIAVFALYHDISEIITGDLPTPVKYYSNDILKNFREIEDDAKSELIKKLPSELADDFVDIICEKCSEEEKKIIKAADKLSALIKCAEELKNGNSEFSKAHESTLNAINNFNIPEVKYFTEKLLPAFYLTLDEL